MDEIIIPTFTEPETEPMPEIPVFYNRHYIRVNSASCIVSGWSDGPHSTRVPTEDDILLNDKGGYQFRLIIDGEPTAENPPLFDGMSMIPLYKWDGAQVVRRSEDELDADRAARARAAENKKWTAARLYEAGEYFTIDNTLYRVTLSIPAGGRIAPGTNCVETTLNDEITKLNNN